MSFKALSIFVITYLFINSAYSQFDSYRDRNYVKYEMEHFGGFSSAHQARLKRYFGGFSVPTMGINLNVQYSQPATGPNVTPAQPAGVATVKTKICLTNGYGVQGGTFFPFIYTGAASAIGFEVAASGHVYNYQLSPINLVSATISSKTMNMLVGVPIGIEYKSGGEVSMNKRDNSLFTIGCGIEPSLCLFTLFVNGTTSTVREYAMMEFGFYQRLGCKIRITYYSGNVPLINQQNAPLNEMVNYKTTGPSGTMNINATGTHEFNFALLFLPFAGKWDN